MFDLPRSGAVACSFVLCACSSVFADDNERGAPFSLERGPYLQLGTPSSVIVRWRTDSETDSMVRYGTDPESLTMSASDPNSTTEHTVELTGLTAGTTYYYSVGSLTHTLTGPGDGQSFTTAPVVGTNQAVRVWVVGDSGTANDDARAVRDAYLGFVGDDPCDVWITVGDNAYPLGLDYDHQRALFDMYPSILCTTPIWTAIGNHDVVFADSPSQTGDYFDIFSLPDQGQAGGVPTGTEAYYSFDYANIHFVCLDTSKTSYEKGSPMLTWLDEDLKATTQDWAIAYFHHPPYSRGHDSDMDDELIEVREQIVPILESRGVDLVLTGHSHSYERSFMLNGHLGESSTLDPSMIVDPGDGREDGDGAYTKDAPGLTPNSGTVYAVSGNAGQITDGVRDHPAMAVSRIELGSMILDINGNRLDARAINEHGVVVDSFTIIKASSCDVDLDHNGMVDFFDLSEFLSTKPDWDGSTSFDFFDLSEFLNDFAAGCP